MRIGDLIQSKWLKASDFSEDEDTVVTVKAIKEEELGQGADKELKYVLYFTELEKGLVLNRTNIERLGKALGEETDDWKGRKVALYVDPDVTFQGKSAPAIRVRSKSPGKPAPKPVKPAREPGEDDDEERPY